MKYFYAFCVALILCGSCEKVVDLNLPNNPNLLVAEGAINNISDFYYVSLRYSTSYSFSDSTDLSEPVSGAQVAIKDDLENIAILSEWRPGTYRTDSLSTFRGIPGRSYHLDIVTDQGKHYLSRPEMLRAPVPIDSLYMAYGSPQKDVPGIYTALLDYTDPAGEPNYYRWHTYLDNFVSITMDIDNDRFIDGRKINGRLMVGLQTFQPGLDTLKVVVRQASLTPEAYEYWEIFLQQYDNQENAPYDIPPSPLIGNIYNADDPDDYALGYFSASGMSEKSIVMRKVK